MSTITTIPTIGTKERTRYTVTIEGPPEDQDATVRRLRAALKSLLRSYQFRAVSVLPVEPNEKDSR